VSGPPVRGDVAERRTWLRRNLPSADGEARRVKLGAGAATEPDVLLDLAHDPAVTVRAALALNAAAPARANDILANDHDEKVRLLLARKLAMLLPSLSMTDQARLYQETWDTLGILVADEAVRVRALIAEAIKSLPDAAHELILRLAYDTEVSVYEPVIRLSPLLTADDLVTLVVKAPAAGTVRAVARRVGLAPAVCDAIAESTDAVAIRALLENPSAQIREATLDVLVARSVEHPDWHEPLVQRPSLPPRTARLLSEIVATHLLEVLAARADLAPPLVEELHRRIAARITAQLPQDGALEEITTDEALGRARALAMNGNLTEESLLDAVRCGEARYATALLAVAAGTSISVVDRAASLRSAKGMISLVWKAGFTMRAAIGAQYVLARLPPDGVLTAGAGDSFPLAVEEMRWQLDFLGRMGR
jgi:uncharacterized protein (DUF2336 family)